MDAAQEYVEFRNQQKIDQFTSALEEPYIGKLELIEADQIVTYRIGKTAVSKDEVTDIIYNWPTDLTKS